jgi:S1-C subfamily serine protease
MHSACTGVVIKTDLFGTSYLTSASLIRSFDDESKIMPFVSIEVHLPKKQVAHGWLYKYDLQYNIAVIETKFFPGLRAINLEHQLQFESHSKVVAVGRCFKSGKLMATSGVLTDDPSGVYRKELMISTCEITMAGVGGPLIDLDGNFVGMNFYAKKRTPFLPRSTITECMANFKTYR